MTNSISEVGFYDALLIIGSNATEAHPIIGSKMKRAACRGARVIVADPRQIELADYAELWLRLRPGTDAALVNGLINIIVSEGWHDRDFIAQRCEGFDKMWKVVKNYPLARVSEITGVPEDKLYAAAEIYAKTRRAGIFYTLGITEHTTGTANVMNLANLAMVTGHVGVEHAGVNPLRGQNNVQGACDMGALPNLLPGYRSVDEAGNVDYFEREWGTSLSSVSGLRIPEMFDSILGGDVKGMYIMGEDPVLTDPDANHVRKAIDSLDFLVVQDIFMSETASLADVVLPAALYAEKDGTFTNTERRVQRVRKAVDAPGEARADWEIICDLAGRMGTPMEYESPEAVFEEIRSMTPAYAGITYARLDIAGLQWPCPDTEHPGTPFLHQTGFPRGKGLLQGIEHLEPAELTSEEYPILLTTGRRLYHYNVSTRNSQLLDGLMPHELAEVNPADAARLGLAEGDAVRVSSRRGTVTSRVTLTEKVPEGTVFMTFHFRETPVNKLTNSVYDPIALTAEYKVCAVRMEKLGPGESGGPEG